MPPSTRKLEWKTRHVPLSVSVCSNVPGFQEPKCFITTGNPEELVKNMVQYMHLVLETAAGLLAENHRIYYNELMDLIHTKEQLELREDEEMMDMEAAETVKEKKKKSTHPLERVKIMYDKWIQEISVIGFNSEKYDINVIKTYLMHTLKGENEMQFVVKKNNMFMC